MNQIHCNKFMQNAFNKYKIGKFGILQRFDHIVGEELIKIEASWMKILKSDLNFEDPIYSGCNHLSKEVHQYDKITGNYLKSWDSASLAADELGITRHAIYACASRKVKESKSAHGYVWSYEKLPKISYSNNTGSNLKTTPIIIYKNNIFLQECKSIGEGARYLKKYLNYSGNVFTLRTALFNSLKNAWKIREVFTAKYKTGS